MRGEAADFIGIVLEGELHILQDDYYGCRSITASVGAGSLLPKHLYAPECHSSWWI